MRLLLIEDDESLCLSLSYQLRQDGFAPETCHDGEEGLLWARQQGYDLILLDRMLPGMDGLTLLRQLRREGIHTPVIFLTALGQLGDKTGGLDAGADDYIVKPFAYDELLARIRCVLRRPAVLSGGDLLRYGDVTYDPGSLTLRRGTASTALSKRLGDLLELFLRNPGQTLPRQTILLRVWGMETEVEDGNLDNYTYFLRRSLRKVGSTLRLTTVRGIGYRLEEGNT
uniref:response regulator transcription factor n=1 Tax=Faecousia sp. TaxID=2952921 RepID=UPI00402A5571